MANPLIKLELMRRFRSQSAAWGIPLLVLLPGLAVVLIYASATDQPDMANFGGGFEMDPQFVGPGMVDFDSGGGGIAVDQLQTIGIGMFVAVLATMLLALLLMVPSMVGGSIAGERHNQTLQPLQLTAMGPTQIVLGKLVSSLAYLVVLLLCAAPVMAIPFLLGGITATQAVGAYLVLLLITVEFAAISLAVSSLLPRPAPAIMVSLVLCAFVTIAPWVAMGMGFMMGSRGDPLFDAETSAARFLASPSPISLGSWVPFGDDVDLLIRNGDRALSLFWYVAIIGACLVFARSRVVAPVERDR